MLADRLQDAGQLEPASLLFELTVTRPHCALAVAPVPEQRQSAPPESLTSLPAAVIVCLSAPAGSAMTPLYIHYMTLSNNDHPHTVDWEEVII